MIAYKIVVTGPFNAGKTAFVRTASEIDIVTTERAISDAALAARVKSETTVAMDYGQCRVGRALFHLYGTPGQARFEVMWSVLAREMDGFVLLVDSTDKASLMEAKQILRQFRKYARVPHVVAANKRDGRSALAPEDVHRLLALPETVPVLPCVALDRRSVLEVLSGMAGMLRQP